MRQCLRASLMVLLFTVVFSATVFSQAVPPRPVERLLPSEYKSIRLGMQLNEFLSANPLSIKVSTLWGDEGDICDFVYQVGFQDDIWGDPRVGFKDGSLVYVGLISKPGRATRDAFASMLKEATARLGNPTLASGDTKTPEQSAVWMALDRIVILSFTEEGGEAALVYMVTPK